MQIINYNPMLMKLYNLEPNILVLSKFSSWDKNEENLITEALKLKSKENNLTLSLMNLTTKNESETAIYPLKTIAKIASSFSNEISYLIEFLISDQNLNQQETFETIKSLLNVQKIVLNHESKTGETLIDLKILKNIFGSENIITFNYQSPSTNLKKVQEALKTGNMKEYFNLTKTNYSLKGEVIDGKKLGRKLGFPTANVDVNEKLILKQGVYYSKVKLPNDEHLYDAMSCHWTNEIGENLLETHLFDFSKDIYHWFIEIELIEYIRENVIVKSEEELISLLKKDEQAIKKQLVK